LGAEHSGYSALAGLTPRKPVNAATAMVVKKRAFDIAPSLDEGWSREVGERFKMPHLPYSPAKGGASGPERPLYPIAGA